MCVCFDGALMDYLNKFESSENYTLQFSTLGAYCMCSSKDSTTFEFFCNNLTNGLFLIVWGPSSVL